MASQASDPTPKLLSCSSCRSRKVKCNKVFPCGPCTRGGMECVFPTRKRNRTPRRTKQTDLLDRLARLEQIVGKVDPEALNKLDSGASDAKPGPEPAARPTPAAPGSSSGHSVPRSASSSSHSGTRGGTPFMPGSIYENIENMMAAETGSTVKTATTTELTTKHGDTERSLSTSSLPDDPTKKYLSQDFWTNLCKSVEGLRVALENSSDSDDDDDEDHDYEHTGQTPGSSHPSDPGHGSGSSYAANSPSSALTTSHILLGNTTVPVPMADALAHPAPDQILFLLSTYFTNVDPLLKILHRPTISAQMTTFLTSGQPRAASPGLDALFFAIYFAAATSLPSGTSPSTTGLTVDRATLVTRFRLATELALARADYLTCVDSLLPLQAFTLYVAILRCHSGSQASWALLALAVRLAHAQGLHRDGDDGALASTAHSPPSAQHTTTAPNNPSPAASSSSTGSPTFFEAEMRRRLWWQLVVLDVRGVEDRGAASLISPDGFSTALPTNISDDSFSTTTTPDDAAAATAADDVATDVTFLLCSAMCSRGMLLVGTPVLVPTSRPSHRPTEETAREVVAGLERRFGAIRGGEAVPVAHLASEVSKLVVLKTWLGLRFPLQVREYSSNSAGHSTFGTSERPLPPSMQREKLAGPVSTPAEALMTATRILEILEKSTTYALKSRYGWYTSTYVQWHPLAVALAELCAQPRGELADRAWDVVMKVWDRSEAMVADSKGGRLWRPIRKLYKKAKGVREAAMRDGGEKKAEKKKVGELGEMGQWMDRGGYDHGAGVGTGGSVLNVPNMAPTWQPEKQMPLPPFNVGTTMGGAGDVSAAMAAEYPAAMSFLDEVDFNTMDLGQFAAEPMDWTNWNEFVSDAQGTGDGGAAAWMMGIG